MDEGFKEMRHGGHKMEEVAPELHELHGRKEEE